MEECIRKLEAIFESANEAFLKKNMMLFETEVSERTLCGALMLELYEVIKNTEYSEYFVDVEYNRNFGGTVKTTRKTIRGEEEQIIKINCDLIVHSRGQNVHQDNLIALEMKKSNRDEESKQKDRERLECLTKRPEQDVWSADGITFPEHVCGYGLGIYYEVDFVQKDILIEYYKEGHLYNRYNLVKEF